MSLHVFVYRTHKFRKYTMDGIQFFLMGLDDPGLIRRLHGYAIDRVILMDNLKWTDLPPGFLFHVRKPIQLEFPF